MPAEGSRSRRAEVPPLVRELLGEIVDYAGLFPPAGLSMPAAVDNYAAYRCGPDAWALGRFVVSAARLEELSSSLASRQDSSAASGWRVSALIGTDVAGDLERTRAFNEREDAAGRDNAVDVLELKGTDEEGIRRALAAVPSAADSYVEVGLGSDPSNLLRAIRDAGGRAKVRTGGVTAEMFPPPEALLRFLRACIERRVPFKATAGLHHPVAGRYPLTYDARSPAATMYGYLNLLVATALARREAPDSLILAALRESDPGGFRLRGDGVEWREQVLGPREVRELRERCFVSFGSCSFREPMDELPLGAAAGPDSTEQALAP